MKTVIIPPNVGEWSFSSFLAEVIWTHAFWRTNGLDVLVQAIEMQRLFDGCQPGASVTISDAGHELLLRQICLPDESRVNPKATAAAWAFLHAVALARTPTLPAPVEKPAS